MADLDLHMPIGVDENTDDVDLSGAIAGLCRAGKRKAIRSEPAAQISEFSINSESEKVKLHELMGTLTSSTAAGELKKQLRNVHKRQKVLETPLSRFEQSALSRSVAYEQTTKEVSKWAPIVKKNEQAEQLEFPLEKPSLKVHTGSELTKKIQPYTPLEKEIAILLHGSDNVLPEKGGLTRAEQRALRAMDIQEARLRRAELQKYRALLSYKESRAKRQKKIKSKQFHRILNKERKKQEGKDLDELKDKDPELLKSKIEKAEKSRIQERMSLKHLGGSKKMKTKMIYAKYDKEARLQIDDMLKTSKDLRQKTAIESDSEEEIIAETVVVQEEKKMYSPWTGSALSGQQNPWLNPAEETAKPSSYSRPEAIVAEKSAAEYDDEESLNTTEEVLHHHIAPSSKETEVFVINDPQIVNDGIEKSRETDQVTAPVKVSEKSVEDDDEEDEERNEIDDIFDAVSKKSESDKKKKRKPKKGAKGKNIGKVDSSLIKTSTDKRKDLKAFKRKKLAKKLKSVVEMNQDKVVDDSGLTISTERKKTLSDMDQLAKESAADSIYTENAKRAKAARYDPSTNIYAEPKIDPTKFLTVSGKVLTCAEAPLVVEGENENDDISQHGLIAEAFADDNVMDIFSKEKAEIEERDKPKAIDLTLPGWGSWGGKDIAISRRKRRKFIVKPLPSALRKDRMLKNVIISETKDNAVAKHQVSWLPRNYKNVHQFESSIRAPVGRDWNPETAFRDLTKPKVVTYLGTVINPMDEGQKFQKEKMKGAPRVAKGRKGKR